MPRHYSIHRIWIPALGVLLITKFLISTHSPFIPTITGAAIKTLLSPFRFVENISLNLAAKRALQEENRVLRKKAGELSLEISRFSELRSENKRLRALAGFKENTSLVTVSAEIVARNPDYWAGSLTINKGASDGVTRGAAVCSAKGLVGKVTDVGKDTSSVMLITHPAFKAGGMLTGTRVNGIVEGSGTERIKMLYLPLDAEVNPGDIVVTSGYSRVFPKGVTIGKIESVEKSSTGLYKYAVISPSADPSYLEEVLCVK